MSIVAVLVVWFVLACVIASFFAAYSLVTFDLRDDDDEDE